MNEPSRSTVVNSLVTTAVKSPVQFFTLILAISTTVVGRLQRNKDVAGIRDVFISPLIVLPSQGLSNRVKKRGLGNRSVIHHRLLHLQDYLDQHTLYFSSQLLLPVHEYNRL